MFFIMVRVKLFINQYFKESGSYGQNTNEPIMGSLIGWTIPIVPYSLLLKEGPHRSLLIFPICYCLNFLHNLAAVS